MRCVFSARVVAVAGFVVGLFFFIGGSNVRAQVSSPGGADVTFHRDVLPILQRSCQICHRPGAIAPMSLMTFEETRPWARSIKRYVEAREMPPWYIDRRIGIQQFKDDPSLTDQEIGVISAWVDAGAPQGDVADAPPLREFLGPEDWRMGDPDLIVSMSEPYILPADGPDVFPNIMVDPELSEDRYIKAVELKPDARSLGAVHHATTHMTVFDEDLTRGNFLNEYAVGKNGDIFDDGTGRLIKAGTKIRFGLHLHPYGEETPVMVRLGLQLYPAGYEPKYTLISQHMGDDDDLLIPAGESSVRTDGYTLLTEPAVITAFQPHLHTRGQAQCIEALIPQTDEEGNVRKRAPGPYGAAPLMEQRTLNCVPKWYFNWHLVYNYAEEVAPVLPAGTVIHVSTWHDNSEALRVNPDPLNNVVYGQRTIDEMSFAWVSYYYIDEEDYKDRVAARKSLKANNQ
jgi:hypothetical protein